MRPRSRTRSSLQPVVAESLSLVGFEFEVDIGAVAHGGHCVARIEDGQAAGRVVFVRHTLPGERVRARITEDGGGSFCRGDAVEILRPAADRVEPPCPKSGPGRCGGCDWQHVTGAGQRALKAAVVSEQLRQLAGIELDVVVEELSGGLLQWRTRTVYAVRRDGSLGLRRHRSHEIEALDDCPIGVPEVGGRQALRTRAAGASGVELARGEDGAVAVISHRPSRAPRRGRGRRPPDEVRSESGPRTLVHHVLGRDFHVTASGFWQVHPRAAETFVDAVRQATNPRPGETVLDLYAGAGLFTAVFAILVGDSGRVLGVESSRAAVSDAAHNLADLPQAAVREGRVSPQLVGALDIRPDIVILDPPRSGVGPEVMAAVIDLAPRVIAYVACDPASLARDLGAATKHGWRLKGLRAFDAFPMTAHVECVAVLEPRQPPIQALDR